jgi:serine/threonine protein kinase
MGIVHAAFDPELERKIALKVLRKAGSEDARARLLREARAMAKLSHPNVITVFDVGSTDGQDFVAMELIDGETLGEWLTRVRPDWRTILAAFVARAASGARDGGDCASRAAVAA